MGCRTLWVSSTTGQTSWSVASSTWHRFLVSDTCFLEFDKYAARYKCVGVKSSVIILFTWELWATGTSCDHVGHFGRVRVGLLVVFKLLSWVNLDLPKTHLHTFPKYKFNLNTCTSCLGAECSSLISWIFAERGSYMVSWWVTSISSCEPSLVRWASNSLKCSLCVW